jgi:hypothetical protein
MAYSFLEKCLFTLWVFVGKIVSSDSILRLGVFFVSDLVDRFPLSVPRVQPIGRIEYPAGKGTDVLVSVDHSRRHDHRARLGLAADLHQLLATRR